MGNSGTKKCRNLTGETNSSNTRACKLLGIRRDYCTVYWLT